MEHVFRGVGTNEFTNLEKIVTRSTSVFEQCQVPDIIALCSNRLTKALTRRYMDGNLGRSYRPRSCKSGVGSVS